MTEAQERHLAEIVTDAAKRIEEKYRRGQKEHGGNLFDHGSDTILDFAIEEAIDMVVYLLTEKKQRQAAKMYECVNS